MLSDVLVGAFDEGEVVLEDLEYFSVRFIEYGVRVGGQGFTKVAVSLRGLTVLTSCHYFSKLSY